MKLRIIVPVKGPALDEMVAIEAKRWISPNTTVDVVHLDDGPASIECSYDEIMSGPGILRQVRAAEDDGVDAIFVTCFGDPGIAAVREICTVPAAGAYEPAVLTALSLGDRVSIVTVLDNAIALIRALGHKAGVSSRIASIRAIDMPVLALHDKFELVDRLVEQMGRCVREDGADVLVLGCTVMLDVAGACQQRLAESGPFIPVVDATGAGILWLESMVRLGVRASRTTYMSPPAKGTVP